MKYKFSDVIIKEIKRRASEDDIKEEHLYDIPTVALIEMVLEYNPDLYGEMLAYCQEDLSESTNK